MEDFNKEEKEIWDKLSEIKVPESRNLRPDFESMLSEFKQGQRPKTYQIFGNWQRWAAAASILVVGLIGGIFFQRSVLNPKTDVVELSNEVHELKQMMMLSLLENPASTERMKAVSYTEEVAVNDKMIDALFLTLNNDEDDNVRLVTVEALTKLAKHARVREGLVQSISKQTSPLVQVALADAMVSLQEKRSIKPFEKILKDQNTNAAVKEKLKESIKILI